MRILPLLLLSALLCGFADPPAQKPIYRMSPQEADSYIASMYKAQPDLRKRIAAIGRQNIGQPYSLNLLGEFPYQLHDNLPLYSLEKSDCVVFAEHTYAMALSQSWDQFFWTLQRIRYKDGVIGVASRNHYTEVDWNVNNRWLLTEITASLAGPNGPGYEITVDRSEFLRTRHRTETTIPVQVSREPYIAKDKLAAVLPQLQEGDMVNVVSSIDGKMLVTHVGLIVFGPDGERRFLNSAEPAVREESFGTFLARTAERETRNGKRGRKLAGFKVLRLNDNVVVPPAAPQPRPAAPAVKL
jgi:hypothetical protein